MYALTLTICALLPLLTTGNVWRGSPPRQMTFPPKRALESIKSLSVLSKHSKLYRSQEKISSQTMRFAFLISFAKALCAGILQVESSITGIGILNLECAVLPPSKFCAARPMERRKLYFHFMKLFKIPVLATHSTMPPSDLILAVMSLKVKVFP